MGDQLGDLFSAKPFPKSPTEAEPVSAPPERPSSSWRWVLPVTLFVLIVAAIAWVSQNLPRGVKPKKTEDETPVSTTRAPELKFLRTKAVWDPKEPEYLKECEQGVPGYYDFPFENPTDRAVTLGFARTSCDCSELEVASLAKAEAVRLKDGLDKETFPTNASWTWTKLPQSDTQGVDIPPQGGGVVRIHWNGRKLPGQALRLNIRMWMQPAGKVQDRTVEHLEVPIIMAEPARFWPDKVAFGALAANGVAQETVIVYSATRDQLKVKVDGSQLDPLFQVSVKGPLDASAIADLTEKLDKAGNRTRIKAAVAVQVKLQEQVGKAQLDQGLFLRPLPVEVEDVANPGSAPTVSAMVKGEIEIGVPEDNGRVTFRSFAASDGARKSIPLWSDDPELKVVKVMPPFLDVALKRSEKESRPGRTRWVLEVRVPPGSQVGAFPEDSVIILQTPSQRRVRIPVVGTAGQS